MSTQAKRPWLRYVAGLTAGAFVILGVEAFMASSRHFFREGPKRRIEGNFGSADSPALLFAVIGDSTSVGVGTTPEKSFPWLLAERLGKRFQVHLIVFGVSGARYPDAVGDQLPQVLSAKPDLVLIELGANDSTHLTKISKVKESVAAMVEALTRTGTKVVLAGPPDMGTTRAFAEPLRTLSGLRGRQVADAVRGQARDHQVPFIELAKATGWAFDREPQKYYSPDMFHPGEAGYALWAEVMYPTLQRVADSDAANDQAHSKPGT